MCECVENKIRQEVNELMQPYKQEKDNLIQILNDIQEKYGYIPKVAQEEVSKYLGKPVIINVVEVARIDVDALLVAESVAQQLEKRIAFRRAMKQAMQRTMRAGAQGIKIMVSGRLGGAEIARSEWAKEGRIPLQTLRADVDYGFTEADTIMGKIGVKVWIFKGNLMPGEKADMNIKSKDSKNSSGERFSGRRGKRRPVETK